MAASTGALHTDLLVCWWRPLPHIWAQNPRQFPQSEQDTVVRLSTKVGARSLRTWGRARPSWSDGLFFPSISQPEPRKPKTELPRVCWQSLLFVERSKTLCGESRNSNCGLIASPSALPARTPALTATSRDSPAMIASVATVARQARPGTATHA